MLHVLSWDSVNDTMWQDCRLEWCQSAGALRPRSCAFLFKAVPLISPPSAAPPAARVPLLLRRKCRRVCRTMRGLAWFSSKDLLSLLRRIHLAFTHVFLHLALHTAMFNQNDVAAAFGTSSSVRPWISLLILGERTAHQLKLRSASWRGGWRSRSSLALLLQTAAGLRTYLKSASQCQAQCGVQRVRPLRSRQCCRSREVVRRDP